MYPLTSSRTHPHIHTLSHTGRVVEQLDGVCQYLIKWADGSCQTQDIMHMFGELTRRRSLRQGHHVLAIAIPGNIPRVYN